MQRHVQVSFPAEADWTFASMKRPCKICGGHGGCRTGYGGQFAGCLQRASERPLTTGGWLHRIDVEIAASGARRTEVLGPMPIAS